MLQDVGQDSLASTRAVSEEGNAHDGELEPHSNADQLERLERQATSPGPSIRPGGGRAWLAGCLEEKKSSGSSTRPEEGGRMLGGLGGDGDSRSPTAAASGSSSMLVLRGLPFNATEGDVIDLVERAGASWALADPQSEAGPLVKILANAQGRPSGFAELRLVSPGVFWDAKKALHMQRMGERYVEAIPPRPEPRERGAGKVPGHHGSKSKREQWRRVV